MSARRLWIGLTLACVTLGSGFVVAHRATASSKDTRTVQYQDQGDRDQRQYGQGDRDQRQYGQNDRDQRRQRWHRGNFYRAVTVPQGTIIPVRIDQPMSTEQNTEGEQWTGVTQRAIVVDGRIVVPAGTEVTGTIDQLQPPRRGQEAVLGLRMDAISQNGRDLSLPGTMEPIVAGSARARNLGIIAGGAAAGAIIGHAVGHSGKGTLLGGLLGGLVGGAYTHSRGGYNIELRAPFTVEFTVDQPVTLRV